jgi:hypothetical protein
VIAIVIVVQLNVGWRAYTSRIREAFAGDGSGVVSAALQQQLHVVRQHAPVGSRFVYVSVRPDEWHSRMWQRLLYPDPVFIVQGVDRTTSKRIARLTRREGVGFVICAGEPPAGIRMLWQMDLPRYTDQKVDFVLGRIAR